MKHCLEKEYGLICLICIAAFFVNNGVIAPDIMEARNIVTAREMVYEGHWLVPTMNGQLRLEKPPLPTWLAATAEAVLPDCLALQRGMAGMAALLLVFYFGKFARSVLHLDPLVPVLMFCTCYNVVLAGRTASWDIYCHAFMMGGIWHMVRAFNAPSGELSHFLAAGIFAGLSILSKGPVSLYGLFLPFLINYVFFYRPPIKSKWSGIAAMVIVAIAIGTWWYAYVHITLSDAFSTVARKESSAWLNHNVRPWWYYWNFFLETGVWSLLLLTAMFLPFANRQRRKSRRWLFSLGWMLTSLILLSLIPEKKNRYLLPLLIPACYVMGCMTIWWKKAMRNNRHVSAADKWCFRANAGLVATTVTTLPAAAWWFILRPGYVSAFVWAAFSLITTTVALYLLQAAVKLHPTRLPVGVAFLFFSVECLFMPALGNVINNTEMRSIAETRGMAELKDVPFCHIDTVPLRIEMVYAARRNIRPVSPDSLRTKVPCVLLTHRPIHETVPENCLKGIETIPIGYYDDNSRPKSSHRYSTDFIYHVTLLKKQKNTLHP